MGTPREAVELLRTCKLLMLADHAPLPSLVSAVAGQPVHGTWWSHPRANLIFELANAIEDSGEALVVKLVAGKVTFVHAALWPALCRVVTDATFRKGALAALSPIAKKLVMQTEQAGRLKLDDVTPDERGAFGKAKGEVEKAMAVLVTSVHTERGNHAAVFESWTAWAATRRDVVRAASSMTFEDALASLRVEAKGAPLTFEMTPKGKRRATP